MNSAVHVGGRCAALYKRFSAPAILNQAKISRVDFKSDFREKYLITSDWETSDVARNDRCKFSQIALVTVDHEVGNVRSEIVYEPSLVSAGNGFPLSNQNGVRIIWSIMAPEPGLRAVCIEYTQAAALSVASRSIKACAPVPGCFVQIWLQGNLLNTIKLPNSGDSACHGEVYSTYNVGFSGAAWSENSKEIVYTAAAVADSEVMI